MELDEKRNVGNADVIAAAFSEVAVRVVRTKNA